MTSPVDGFQTSPNRFVRASTHCPPIRHLQVSVVGMKVLSCLGHYRYGVTLRRAIPVRRYMTPCSHSLSTSYCSFVSTIFLASAICNNMRA